MSFQPNTIYCGDCQEVLPRFPEGSVDLIYADPPFFSNRRFEVIWGDGYEMRSFEDRWKGGIQNYVAWLAPKLRECRRVLKDTGSLYLHLDSHASHYMKVEMDKISSGNLASLTKLFGSARWEVTATRSKVRNVSEVHTM